MVVHATGKEEPAMPLPPLSKHLRDVPDYVSIRETADGLPILYESMHNEPLVHLGTELDDNPWLRPAPWEPGDVQFGG